MTDCAREITLFVTPSGLFEWNRMPFGLKNAPQIYMRLIDNALYGYSQISADRKITEPHDVFTEGKPDQDQRESVLGRRSYIDDILVTATSWDILCDKVERLLDTCEQGLEANPKDLGTLSNLPFPRSLKAMQSFQGIPEFLKPIF